MTTDVYAGERPRLSPFHERQQVFNVREAWSIWNGYKFAEHYYEPEYEYFCIRNQCGTYDISAMQKYEIRGADAERMLNRLVTRDVTKIGMNRVAYCVWCTDEGRLIDDGTIFKLADDRFMLTSGASCIAWLDKAAYGFSDVSVTDVTDDIAALAFQGPTTCAVLKVMGLDGIEELKPFGIARFPFEDGELMVSRTGFTGDLGYELWIEPRLALALWDALYAAGDNYGIQPFGEAALNMARLEAGFIMPGMEFNEALATVHFEHDQTPYELNLGWLVDLSKPHFSGRQALLEEERRGPTYTLTKLDIEGNKPAEGAWLYKEEACRTHIGYVTSAMWSPAVKANIALAMIRTEHLDGPFWAEIYYEKELRHYGRVARCTKRDKPFWSPARARATPPPDY